MFKLRFSFIRSGDVFRENRGLKLMSLTWVLFACEPSTTKKLPPENHEMKMEIVAGASIGPLRLGMPRDEIPEARRVERGAGSVDNIEFFLENDVIVELWIKDLRSFPHEVRYEGRTVDPLATSTQLKEIFGPCSETEPVLGGVRFDCAPGLQLGFGGPDGSSVQVRVRRGT